MTTYIIGYDLKGGTEDEYEDLIDAIKGLGGTWWHHLDSTWLVVSEKTASEIRDELWQHMHTGDELLVAKLSGAAAWKGFNEKGSTWLKDNL